MTDGGEKSKPAVMTGLKGMVIRLGIVLQERDVHNGTLEDKIKI